MSRQLAAVVLLAAGLPLGVSVPRDTSSTHSVDQSATRVLLAAGGGDYDILQVISGCDAPATTYRTRVLHTDVGAQAEYEFNAHGYVLGLRGGVLNEKVGTLLVNGVPSSQGGQSRSLTYVNPYVAREGRVVGLGLGGMLASEEFVKPGLRTGPKPGLQTGPMPLSGHFRLGQRHGWNLAVRYMEAVPLVAGGDYVDVGLGTPLGGRGEAWIGMGLGGPADLQTMGLRAKFQIVPALALEEGVFLGHTAGSDGQEVRATGWHVGLEWQRTRARTLVP